MALTMSVIGKTILFLAVIANIFPQGRTTSLGNLPQQEVTSTPQVEGTTLVENLPTTPEPSRDPFRFLIMCAPGSKKRNICEKCTKVTRDPNTYQMCCENSRGVRNWCEKFLNPSIWMKVANSAS